ncbi:MAG: hypothetical protein V1817_00395 [Candidatus Micrarchaeota archaeon]
MEAVVRLDGAVGMILDKLVDLGYFRTRSEAIRAGVLELGKEFEVFHNAKELEAELVIRKVEAIDREIEEGKRKVTPARLVFKEAGLKKAR